LGKVDDIDLLAVNDVNESVWESTYVFQVIYSRKNKEQSLQIATYIVLRRSEMVDIFLASKADVEEDSSPPICS